MKAESARASEVVDTPELAKLSAVDLLDGYRAGRFTPREVIEDVIAALARLLRGAARGSAHAGRFLGPARAALDPAGIAEAEERARRPLPEAAP